MISSGVLFMSISLLKDHLVFEWISYKFTTNKFVPRKSHDQDDDVKREVDKITKMTNSEVQSGNLVLHGLSKFYKTNLAVNQLHLQVDNAECFGLLVNFSQIDSESYEI